MKTIKVYNSDNLTSALTSPMNNSYSEKKISEFKSDELEFLVKGQIIDVIYILEDKKTEQLNDTIINNESCFHFGTNKKGLIHSLYISKITLFPVLLRITTNTFQPFIEEYRYRNFKYSSKLIIPDLSKSKNKSAITTTLIKENDILPNWSLHDLQGNKVSFEKSGKYKIIYLSMINCGPCQKAIPHVENMFNIYNKTKDIEFFVFYPIDSKENLEKYVQRKKIKTQVVYNSLTPQNKRLKIINQLNMGFPAILIVDKENHIKHIINGFSSDFEERVKKRIDKLTVDKN
jgi:thiol-disulfide isomerase/thioredoxin